jgi:hypothetical protein
MKSISASKTSITCRTMNGGLGLKHRAYTNFNTLRVWSGMANHSDKIRGKGHHWRDRFHPSCKSASMEHSSWDIASRTPANTRAVSSGRRQRSSKMNTEACLCLTKSGKPLVYPLTDRREPRPWLGWVSLNWALWRLYGTALYSALEATCFRAFTSIHSLPPILLLFHIFPSAGDAQVHMSLT